MSPEEAELYARLLADQENLYRQMNAALISLDLALAALNPAHERRFFSAREKRRLTQN